MTPSAGDPIRSTRTAGSWGAEGLRLTASSWGQIARHEAIDSRAGPRHRGGGLRLLGRGHVRLDDLRPGGVVGPAAIRWRRLCRPGPRVTHRPGIPGHRPSRSAPPRPLPARISPGAGPDLVADG